MQPNNVKDKYAVAIFQEGKKKVIGHISLEKSGKFAKTIFYFLKTAKKTRYQIIVHGRAVSQNDGLRMKVPSRLLFTAEENSLLFSKKGFLNCCNYIVKESEQKKIKHQLFFRLSNQPSDPWKFSKVNSLEKYDAFSLIDTPFTGTFSDFSLLNNLSSTLLTWS